MGWYTVDKLYIQEENAQTIFNQKYTVNVFSELQHRAGNLKSYRKKRATINN